MKKIALCLLLFACFATVVANQVSYSNSFPVFDCNPESSSIEEALARLDKMENSSLVLHCFKTSDFKTNRTVCTCHLYRLESAIPVEIKIENVLSECSTKNSSLDHNGYRSRVLSIIIWTFFYIQILFYAYHVVSKCRKDVASTKCLHQGKNIGLLSDSDQNNSLTSEEEHSEVYLGEGLGKLHTSPILPSNFDTTSSNMELELRANNEYIFIQRPCHRPIVENWLNEQTVFGLKSKDDTVLFSGVKKSTFEKDENCFYEPQCGCPGFLINFQRSKIFLEGIPGYNSEKPSRCWASMHNIGEHVDIDSKGWRHSLPNICAKWSFNSKVGYSLLPNPLMRKEKGTTSTGKNSSLHESDDNLESISVAYLRRFYERYKRRKTSKANKKTSSATSSDENSSDNESWISHFSLSTARNSSSLSNLETSEQDSLSCLQSEYSSAQSNTSGVWTLYRYPIPPSITSSSPQYEQFLEANKEYIFIQRPHLLPSVNKWLEDTQFVLTTKNSAGDSDGYSSYLINNDKTEIIRGGVPGPSRNEVNLKSWRSMPHISGNHSQGWSSKVHGSLPNISDEFGFKHKPDFNERISEQFVLNTKGICCDEEQRNWGVFCEDNLESISVAFEREMQEDQQRRDAARAKVEENKVRCLVLSEQEPKPKSKASSFLTIIKQELHKQVVLPLVLQASKIIIIEILRQF